MSLNAADPWSEFTPADPTGPDMAGTNAQAPAPSAVAAAPASGASPSGPKDDPWAEFKPAPDGPAPITDSGTTMGFADQAPTEGDKQLSPDDTATFYKMLRGDGVPKASADELRSFVASKGLVLQDADEIVQDRDGGKGVVGQISYPLPKVESGDGATGAAVRGVANGLTLGLAPRLFAVGDSVNDVAAGKGWDYTGNLDTERGRAATDMDEHPIANIAGELLGGVALPVGLEKAGVTASMSAVGLAARNAALMEGHTDAEAAAIAQRAIAKRMIAEGAAYGGAYGTDSSYGGVGAHVVGGVTGALEGAALPIAAQAVAPITRPLLSRGADAMNAIYNAGRRAFAPFTQEGAQDTAANILRKSTTGSVDDAVANIASAPAPVDGVQPTLAEVAQDPGLAGLQRGHANTDLNTAAAIGERNASNGLARTHAVSEAMGDGSPQAIQDYASSQLGDAEQATAAQQASRQATVDARLDTARQSAGQARTDAETNLSSAIDALGPTADRDATGATARDAFDQAYEGAKQRTRDAYADPALTKPIPLTIARSVFTGLRDAADDFYGDGGGEIPAKLQSILGDMADPNATTRTLTNIDRRLADFAGESRMQGRRSEAAFAERVRGDLGNFVQQAAPPEYRAAITQAKAVRADQGRIFETGDAPTAFARDRFNNPAVGNNSVPARLVRPGAAGGDTAEGLIQAIGPNTAESIVRQEIRRAVEERGVQTAAQARALATRYGEAARRFPAVQSDMQNLVARAGELDASRGIETRALSAKPTPDEIAAVRERSALHDHILASPLGRAANPDVDPSSFVGELMRRADQGRRMKVLIAQTKGQPDAANGLRRTLGDYIIGAGAGPNFTASGDRIPSINKTRQAIVNVTSRAGDALTSQQKLVLRLVNRELEQANFANTASKPAGSETALNSTFKDMMSFVPGITGKTKFILSKVLGALGNGDEVKRLITQSILDPDFAATLLKRPTEAHWTRIQTGLAGRKMTVGGVIVNQPANDTLGLHQILSNALNSVPGRAAAGENVDDRRKEPPDQQRQGNAGR